MSVDKIRDVEVGQRRIIYLVSVECIYLLFSFLCAVIKERNIKMTQEKSPNLQQYFENDPPSFFDTVSKGI